jgi:hypothetical protein
VSKFKALDIAFYILMISVVLINVFDDIPAGTKFTVVFLALSGSIQCARASANQRMLRDYG